MLFNVFNQLHVAEVFSTNERILSASNKVYLVSKFASLTKQTDFNTFLFVYTSNIHKNFPRFISL